MSGPTRGSDERGEFIASSHTLPDGQACEHRWYLLCPNCGTDQSGLLRAVHDFDMDCPNCREGPFGSTGESAKPFISARNVRRLARREARRRDRVMRCQ